MAYAYGPNDSPASALFGSGLRMELVYDQASRPVEVRHLDGSGNVLWLEAFTYDAAGNRLTVGGEGGALTRYEYDPLDRLVAETD